MLTKDEQIDLRATLVAMLSVLVEHGMTTPEAFAKLRLQAKVQVEQDWEADLRKELDANPGAKFMYELMHGAIDAKL